MGSFLNLYVFPLTTPEQIHELESLLIKVANPPGNKKRGKIPGSLQNTLKKHLFKNAREEIKGMVHGVTDDVGEGEKGTRLTIKKINALSQKELAEALGTVQPNICILRKKDPKKLTALRQYIVDKGCTEKILLLAESKAKDKT